MALSSLHIALPVFNESQTLPHLFARLDEVIRIDLSGFECRVIAVDDGSSDDSFMQMVALREKYSWLTIVRFTRNFGHHIAILAALDHCDADIVAIMDSDLQDPPEELPKLVAALSADTPLVYAIRKSYQTSAFRRFASAWFWTRINRWSGLDMPLNQAMMRVFTRKVHVAITQCREHHRFTGGLFAYTGFRYKCVEIESQPRAYGTSQYSLPKMISLGLNALLGYSYAPARWLFNMGICVMALALFAFPALACFFLPQISNLVIPFLLFALGMLFCGLGSLLYVQLHILAEAKNRPLYFIETIIE